MKQLLLILTLFISFSSIVTAQDYIHLRNKKVIKVRKAKEKNDVIYYREYDSNSKVKLFVPKSEVAYIEYSNGEKVDYSQFKPSVNPKRSIALSNDKKNTSRIMETPQFHSFMGISGGMALPVGNYAKNNIYDGFNNVGFAKLGWYGEIFGGYYFTEQIAIQGKYGSFRNKTSYKNQLLFFQIPIGWFGVDDINIGDWSHQYFAIGPKFSFPILMNSYLDLGIGLGSLYSTEPLYEVIYIYNTSGSFTNIPGKENGLLYNFEIGFRFKIYKKLFLTYQMSYLTSNVDFTATHYIENGVKFRYAEEENYSRKFELFNLGFGLKIVL